MKATRQRSLILMVTIFVMTLSLFNPGTVFADDGQPPVEPVVTEEPLASDEPAGTPEPVITDPASIEETVEEETSVQEILEQIPGEIAVIVLNEDGQPEPMASEAAAETILTSDPMWCPTGQTPGDPGCTVGYATAAELIVALNGVTGDGTIYFMSTYSTDDLTFDQMFNSNLSGLGALTIQGGWNGSSGNAFALSGSTLFSGVGITITHWNGNVTLNDVVVDGALGDGITIYYTNSDIQLANVSSNNNSNDGFYIESNGEITATNIAANDNGFAGAVLFGGDGVTLNGTNTFNDNDNSYGLGVFSYTDIVLNNIMANSNNGGAGVYIDNTMGSGDVALNGANTFNGNMEGLFILSNGNITANNVEASNNVGNGAYIDNNLFGRNESITIFGTNIFNANGNYGLIVHASEDIDVSNVTANDNTDSGMYLDNCNDFGVGCTGNGDVIISGINIFNGNDQSGVNVVSTGSITIENVMANENDMSGISLIGYGSPVTVSSSVFNSNGHYGIDAEYVSASMILDNVNFDCLNGLGDYIYGDTVFHACPAMEESPADGEDQTANDQYSLHVVFVVDNEDVELDCRQYAGTMFIFDNGNRVTLKCPITGFGSLHMIENENLPAPLPGDVEFVSGLAAVQSPNDNDVRLDGNVVISFLIPENMKNTNFAILYWDGSHWVDLDSATFKDGREVFNGGHPTGDGYFEAVTNFIGTFVLVKK